MATNEEAATGMAILTAFVLHDREGFMAVTSDMPDAKALALLGRASEMVVRAFADLNDMTKEQALDVLPREVVNAG